MKSRRANNKILVKARPASGKIVATPSRQLAGSELSLRRGGYSHGEIVVSPIRQFQDRKIVQALSAQLVSRFLSLAPGFSQVSGADRIDQPFQRFLRAGGKPLKRFARPAVVNTRLKPGVNERSHCVVPSDFCGTTALTPALSPRRGSIVRRLMEKRATEFAGRSIAKLEAHYCCSLSPGERVRVRASVKTNFMERDGIHVANYVTKLIPKKQLKRKLHEAVRLARARLEENKLR